MKIKDIMTSPVATVTPDTSVGAIARLLVDKNISGAPVVDAAGRVVGMVTEGDLIVRNADLHFPRFLQILDARIYLESPKHFEEELRRMLGATAADIMSSPVITVSPDDDLERAATLMTEEKINAVPVLDNGRLAGIITRTDIVRLLADQEREA